MRATLVNLRTPLIQFIGKRKFNGKLLFFVEEEKKKKTSTRYRMAKRS